MLRPLAVVLLLALAACQCHGQSEPRTRVDPDRLRAHLERLPADRAINGDETDLEGLRKTAALIEDQLESLGYEVHEQRVDYAPRMRPADGAEPETVASRNLWVDLPGTDLAGEVLILCAHFDAVDGSPGADDNGTGVAANLELARVLKDAPRRRSIRFLFTTAEEVGLVGAFRYARGIAEPAIDRGDERILGMISLEMLGYFSDEPGSQTAPVRGLPDSIKVPDQGNFIAVVGVLPHLAFHGPLVTAMQRAEPELKIITTGLIPAPTRDLGRSDHAAFWSIGVPAVMLTDTANFRNPHYHQPTDTVETLDFERFTMVVRAVAGAVHELAEPVEEAEKKP